MVTHAPANKGAEPPQFSAHYYCGQTVARIKMPLGTEVGLSLGDIVLDGDPAPPPQRAQPSHFSANVRCGQTAGWTNGTWYGGRPRPRRLCVRWGPSYPQKKGTPIPPNFRPISIVAKWLDELK